MYSDNLTTDRFQIRPKAGTAEAFAATVEANLSLKYLFAHYELIIRSIILTLNVAGFTMSSI